MRAITIALGAALALGLVAAPASANTTTGTGWIYCLLHLSVLEVPCEPGEDDPLDLKGADHPSLSTASNNGVTFTLTWDAYQDDAEQLYVFIHGNPECATVPEEIGCEVVEAAGPSPLTLNLGAAAASNAALSASIHLVGACSFTPGPYYLFFPEHCDVPPFQLVEDQPFSYTWEVH